MKQTLKRLNKAGICFSVIFSCYEILRVEERLGLKLCHQPTLRCLWYFLDFWDLKF